jgi:hypothetical protein
VLTLLRLGIVVVGVLMRQYVEVVVAFVAWNVVDKFESGDIAVEEGW